MQKVRSHRGGGRHPGLWLGSTRRTLCCSFPPALPGKERERERESRACKSHILSDVVFTTPPGFKRDGSERETLARSKREESHQKDREGKRGMEEGGHKKQLERKLGPKEAKPAAFPQSLQKDSS
ncbi:hypothetical protein AOLI_G00250200 [Acnodon oligacanthus]